MLVLEPRTRKPCVKKKEHKVRSPPAPLAATRRAPPAHPRRAVHAACRFAPRAHRRARLVRQSLTVCMAHEYAARRESIAAMTTSSKADGASRQASIPGDDAGYCSRRSELKG